MPDPIRRRSITAHDTPTIQQGHRVNDKGDANTQTGTPHTRRGAQQHSRPSLTMPPTIRYATPPSTTAPPTTTTRGEQTEDTPPHEHHRHTDTHSPPTHLARNSVRHDSSTRQHCSGMSRARAAPLHWAGQQQHIPPPFHTPRKSGHHPLIYSHSFTFTQQMINNDQ